MFKVDRYFDLTAPIYPYMPVWPSNPPVELKPIVTVPKDGYLAEIIEASTHTGTHIDAPAHMIEGGTTVDDLDLASLIGTGYCLKVLPDGHTIRSTHLAEKWQGIYNNSILLIETGWYKKRGYTREFQYDFPGLSEDAADFLIQKHVKAVGIDTLGIEPYENTDFRVHKKLLRSGIPIIEDLYGLDSLEEGRPYLIIALPLRLKGTSGSMARVVAAETE
ncbi:hypothetical protein [Thermoplasma volcanium GSS1]|uniref:Cyclase n=1 Tax=Thermoplasma volcanium (strain ATCC 51530 / DSM 4299 / JCM 9571 / NBRC 15438 / GSS1) TaxID=273116 RepID=Q97AD8_THEVO|nr:cyclase family protein [Thermoplasma volcanium]BAB60014.1 hypothetical protein [Thermoplasma volcanium GSS1]